MRISYLDLQISTSSCGGK
ncbi:hypothetical protein LINPERPRIM_LOCUS32780 [Linum perenne]